MLDSGRIATLHGVHFLELSGDPSQRAAQHGAFARSTIHNSALPVLAEKNIHLFNQVLPLPIAELVKLLYGKILNRSIRQLSKDERSIGTHFCKEAGIDESIFWKAMAQPDLMMVLVRLSLLRWLAKDLPPMALPGCSSAVALGKHTKSGRLMTCRNLDYPIVGPWEKNTAVLFHKPKINEIPHITVTSLGFHTSSMSAMNGEGITVNMHAHYGKNVSTSGKFITFIGDEIISKAKNLDDAIRIVKKHKRIGNWAFVIASAKDSDGIVIEMNHDEESVRYASNTNGLLSHTNYFFGENLRSEEAFLSTVISEDLLGRCSKLTNILQKQSGFLEMPHFAKALGDLIDPYTKCTEVSGNTLAAITTVASVVFSPENQEILVSSRDQSPTSFGPYLKVQLDKFWSSPEDAVQVIHTDAHPDHIISAVQKYREAYRAWHMEHEDQNNPVKTIRALESAIELYPDESNLKLQLGLVFFRAGKVEKAFEILKKSNPNRLSPGAQEVLRLMKARCNDVLGNRAEAISLYQELQSSSQDPRIVLACKKGIKKKYRLEDKKKLLIDLQFPDALVY